MVSTDSESLKGGGVPVTVLGQIPGPQCMNVYKLFACKNLNPNTHEHKYS